MISLENYKTGATSLCVVDETVAPVFIGFYMHVALKEIIDSKAPNFFERGLIAAWLKRIADANLRVDEVGAQVLTLQHLRAGFVLIVVFLSVSFLAFVAECTPKVTKKLFELFLACYIVVKFTKKHKMF
jgi:hypothetical protein